MPERFSGTGSPSERADSIHEGISGEMGTKTPTPTPTATTVKFVVPGNGVGKLADIMGIDEAERWKAEIGRQRRWRYGEAHRLWPRSGSAVQKYLGAVAVDEDEILF